MGHNEDSMYKFDGSFDDVTGSEYVVGREFDSSWIAGTLIKAKLDAEAAAEAHETIRLQAISALRDQGLTVREIADTLQWAGVSKSAASRSNRARPRRFQPQPPIDQLVERAWREGPQNNWEWPEKRDGDHPRRLTISINILASAGN
ncbi:hypothetical protein [Arthrobacter sp.]|uniref:hypothetical protein n=1 Tax=Arthrobacter sp. TaxID=1667 RepID=UPI0026E0B39D|nr:hypothetical protein [Arthrobacter sp.]MDO5754360.1 hypothetical protein [Arthrobacter sp.]